MTLPLHSIAVTVRAMGVKQCAVQSAIGDMLEPIDRLALLIAALCHDIDHPGHNNAFEVSLVTAAACRRPLTSPALLGAPAWDLIRTGWLFLWCCAGELVQSACARA